MLFLYSNSHHSNNQPDVGCCSFFLVMLLSYQYVLRVCLVICCQILVAPSYVLIYLVGNCISSCVRWLHCSLWTPLKCLNGVRFSINVLFLSIIFSCFINWISFICGLGRFLDSYREAVNVLTALLDNKHALEWF